MRVVRRKLVIIGGGPAAYTAGIYAGRANLDPLCIEGYAAGGMLMSSLEPVENFPGFPAGVAGPDLMDSMREQALRFGTEMVGRDVMSANLSGSPFRIRTSKDEIVADAVILATGGRERRLGLPSEDALDGRGVAYCPACDGAFFAGQRVAVVGGGDCAMEFAMSLSKIASEVVVVHRRDDFRAADVMVGYAAAHDNISFLKPFVVDEILDVEAGRVTGLRLRNPITGEQRNEDVQGVFVAIGHAPSTELFLDQIEHDHRGYVAVRRGTTETSVPGLFAAGDVHDHRYRQVVTAAASGCMAAMDAERWLAHLGSWTATIAEPHAVPAGASPLIPSPSPIT